MKTKKLLLLPLLLFAGIASANPMAANTKRKAFYVLYEPMLRVASEWPHSYASLKQVGRSVSVHLHLVFLE